jgi:hypothetical protein
MTDAVTSRLRRRMIEDMSNDQLIGGSRPALIESSWKNAGRVVQGSGAVQGDAISS